MTDTCFGMKSQQMSALIFDYEKQIALLKKFETQFIECDFLYKIGAEILIDCAVRSQSMSGNLLLYGYFGDTICDFSKISSNIINAFLIPVQVPCLCRSSVQSVQIIEEKLSMFENNQFDCAFSNLSLHFINDIPCVLRNYNRIINTQGLLLITLIGEDSLFELRDAFHNADEQINSGVFSRIMPMISSDTMMRLVNNNGFSNSVMHQERITVTYTSLIALLRDLRRMGFGNFLNSQGKVITPYFLEIAESYYIQHHSLDGQLKLTFNIITISTTRS